MAFKRYLVVLTIMVMTSQALSQGRSVVWGGLMKEGYKSDHQLIAKDPHTGASYWLYFEDHEIWFASFDRNNKRIQNHKVDYTKEKFKHTPFLMGFAFARGKILVLVAESGKHYIHELDPRGKVSSKLIEIPGNDRSEERRVG